MKTRWELYVDGAARNNPGPAGAGIYLTKDGVPIEQKGLYLGDRTNNQAEYLALLFGLYYVCCHIKSQETLIIKSDSELMVRQIKGIYKIKNTELQQIFRAAHLFLEKIDYSIQHVPREENKIADRLANMGIDKKITVPQELLKIWPL